MRFLLSGIVVFIPCLALAEREASAAPPLPPIKWEWHLKLGTQSYLNEIDPDPGTAGMYGWVFGHRFSERSLIGVSGAIASYEIGFQEKNVASILLLYRRYWRVDRKFQPYLDAGAGLSDPIVGYDRGAKGAFTFAFGAIWRIIPGYGVAIESRGVSWSQDDTFLFEGSSITVASNEFSLSFYRSF